MSRTWTLYFCYLSCTHVSKSIYESFDFVSQFVRIIDAQDRIIVLLSNQKNHQINIFFWNFWFRKECYEALVPKEKEPKKKKKKTR